MRVYYEDTDTAGVVYHANYLAFCERARTEWLRAYGFSQQALFERHIAFAVRDLSARYLQPACLDDILTIETLILRRTPVRIIFEQSILRDGEVIFRAEVCVICLDMQRRRPIAFPADIVSRFQAT